MTEGAASRQGQRKGQGYMESAIAPGALGLDPRAGGASRISDPSINRPGAGDHRHRKMDAHGALARLLGTRREFQAGSGLGGNIPGFS